MRPDDLVWLSARRQRECGALRRNCACRRAFPRDTGNDFWFGAYRLQLLLGEEAQSRIRLPRSHLPFPGNVVDVSGDGGRYSCQSWLLAGKRGHQRFLFFVASRSRRGCKPHLVLSLCRREKLDHAVVVIREAGARLLEPCPRSISWRPDTESL